MKIIVHKQCAVNTKPKSFETVYTHTVMLSFVVVNVLHWFWSPFIYLLWPVQDIQCVQTAVWVFVDIQIGIVPVKTLSMLQNGRRVTCL